MTDEGVLMQNSPLKSYTSCESTDNQKCPAETPSQEVRCISLKSTPTKECTFKSDSSFLKNNQSSEKYEVDADNPNAIKETSLVVDTEVIEEISDNVGYESVIESVQLKNGLSTEKTNNSENVEEDNSTNEKTVRVEIVDSTEEKNCSRISVSPENKTCTDGACSIQSSDKSLPSEKLPIEVLDDTGTSHISNGSSETEIVETSTTEMILQNPIDDLLYVLSSI